MPKRGHTEISSVIDYVIETVKVGLHGVATDRFHRSETQVVFYVPRIRTLFTKHIQTLINTECYFDITGSDDKLKVTIYHRNMTENTKRSYMSTDFPINVEAKADVYERWKKVVGALSECGIMPIDFVIKQKTMLLVTKEIDARQLRTMQNHLKEIKIRVSKKQSGGVQGVHLTGEII